MFNIEISYYSSGIKNKIQPKDLYQYYKIKLIQIKEKIYYRKSETKIGKQKN